ncbi:Reverse transcriptase [Ceratobasidium sp. AG-Ba]|nr:Reverse transcriptase [Ceratobasidium sp. AG-Ba]
MSSSEWIQAWKRLSGLFDAHIPEDADGWEVHYTCIYYDETFDKEFQLWLRFDIQVRVRVLHESLDPAEWQANIFKTVERAYNSEQMQPQRRIAAPRRRSASPPQTRSSYRSYPATSTEYTSRAPHGRASQSRNHSTRPYDSAMHPNASTANRSHVYAPATAHSKLLARPSVMHSAAQWAAPQPLAASMDNTPARFAESLITTLNTAAIDPRKVITPFLPNAWYLTLKSLNLLDQFSDIPPGLYAGFCLGASLAIPKTQIPPNHKSALDAPEAVTAHIHKEDMLGRYSVPFSRSFLNSSDHSGRMNVILCRDVVREFCRIPAPAPGIRGVRPSTGARARTCSENAGIPAESRILRDSRGSRIPAYNSVAPTAPINIIIREYISALE